MLQDFWRILDTVLMYNARCIRSYHMAAVCMCGHCMDTNEVNSRCWWILCKKAQQQKEKIMREMRNNSKQVLVYVFLITF